MHTGDSLYALSHIRDFISVSWGASVSYPRPNFKACYLRRTFSRLIWVCGADDKFRISEFWRQFNIKMAIVRLSSFSRFQSPVKTRVTYVPLFSWKSEDTTWNKTISRDCGGFLYVSVMFCKRSDSAVAPSTSHTLNFDITRDGKSWRTKLGGLLWHSLFKPSILKILKLVQTLFGWGFWHMAKMITWTDINWVK
jgi:hypothetical protein